MRGIFLDIETNGLNPYTHRPIEIALQILDLKTGEVLKTYESCIQISPEDWGKSDPASLQINHFTKETALAGKPLSLVKEDIISLFDTLEIKRKKSVFICQNPSFDRAFFSQIIPVETQEKKNWPYHWLDLASMFWALQIQDTAKPKPWDIGLSKDSIAMYFNLEKEQNPHRAMNGVNHLIACYKAVVGFPTTAKAVY